jgi:hypothetical protein
MKNRVKWVKTTNIMTALESRNCKVYESFRSFEKEHLKYTKKYNTFPVMCLHLRLYVRFHGAYVFRTKKNKYCNIKLDQKKINMY